MKKILVLIVMALLVSSFASALMQEGTLVGAGWTVTEGSKFETREYNTDSSEKIETIRDEISASNEFINNEFKSIRDEFVKVQDDIRDLRTRIDNSRYERRNGFYKKASS